MWKYTANYTSAHWFRNDISHSCIIDEKSNACIESLALAQKHMCTQRYRRVWTWCPTDNLHRPCFWLSCKHIFFDCVTLGCVTGTGMTNQVWQSKASRFCADAAGLMKPSNSPVKKRESDAHRQLCFALNYFMFSIEKNSIINSK